MSMTPEELRLFARAQTYPNRAVEEENVQEANRIADEAVHRSEVLMRQEAHERIESSDSWIRVTSQLSEVLQNEVRHPLIDGELPGPQITNRFQQLQHDAGAAIRELNLEADRLEHLATRLDSPAADVEKFLARFPSLKIR